MSRAVSVPPAKPAKPARDWQAIRAQYEAGGPRATFRSLGVRHGVSHTAVRKRAVSEGWKQDLGEAVHRATLAQVSGVDSAADPKKRDAAVNAEGARRAGILRRHQDEWIQVAKLRQEALAKRLILPAEAEGLAPDALIELQRDRLGLAFLAAKLAKITAEMTSIQQAGERLAHMIEPPGGRDGGKSGGSAPVSRIEVVYRNESLHGDLDDDGEAEAES